MTDAVVSMDVRKISNDISAIDIAGTVNRNAEAALTEAYRLAGAERTRAIILNFVQLEYLNSSGIGLLVPLLVRAKRHNQQVFAYGLNEHYREIFALTRLDEVIRIFP